MVIDYEKLPPESRIWIYGTNQKLNIKEQEMLCEKTYDFLENWQSHSKAIRAGFQLLEGWFLVLAVQENTKVSGCGIDASVHFLQKMEKLLQVNFLDKTRAYFRNAKNQIQVLSLKNFQTQIKQGNITKNTKVFNNLIKTKGQISQAFEIPLFKSWHKRYL